MLYHVNLTRAYCRDAPSKRALLDHGWDRVPQPREALYDLRFDPDETHDVSAVPRYAAVLTEMRARLDDWMRQTADPLLNGDLPIPPGARVDDIDAPDPIRPGA